MWGGYIIQIALERTRYFFLQVGEIGSRQRCSSTVPLPVKHRHQRMWRLGFTMHHAGVAVHPHYSVVGCGSSPCFQPVLTVVVVLKQPSLIIHTSRDLLQQSVLVDYCCCSHLASGASTALGSYIGHRNKRRLLSTLREEFVEKKYQVFDIIGLLLILSQVNPSSPVERV